MSYTVIGGIGTVTSNFSISNPCNIMSLDNIVMICDDVEISSYIAGDVILTLSDNAMLPLSDLIIPVCITTNNQTVIKPLTISSNGELSLDENYTLATVHLNGICWHVNSTYYTPSIGNIYNNGTSPLSVI